MFTNSHNFTVERSTFNDAESITINYNILLHNDARSAGPGRLDEEEREKLKELVGMVESLALGKDENQKAERQGEAVKPAEEDQQSTVEPVPEAPAVRKRLIFYTNLDNAAKKLKRPVNILFTLTPYQIDVRSAIVWKILSFQPLTRSQETVHWFDGVGFTAVKEKGDGSLKSGDLAVRVKHNHVAVLVSEDDTPVFSDEEVKMPAGSLEGVAISNMTDLDQRFALCMIDDDQIETNSFTPVMDIGIVKPKDIVVCGLPVMLQAYTVPNGYHVLRRLDTSKLKPLFVEGNKPRAVDLRTCGEKTAFRLYTNMRGNVLLEKDDK